VRTFMTVIATGIFLAALFATVISPGIGAMGFVVAFFVAILIPKAPADVVWEGEDAARTRHGDQVRKVLARTKSTRKKD